MPVSRTARRCAGWKDRLTKYARFLDACADSWSDLRISRLSGRLPSRQQGPIGRHTGPSESDALDVHS